MKKLFFFLLLLSGGFASAQDYNVPVGTTEECKKAEPVALVASKLIISKPLEDKDAIAAENFLLKWMVNTEYSFEVGGNITKLSKKDNGRLLFVYMAAMTQYVLENPDKAKDKAAVSLAAYTVLADYVSNSANGVKETKDVKHLIQAKKDGKLKEYAQES